VGAEALHLAPSELLLKLPLRRLQLRNFLSQHLLGVGPIFGDGNGLLLRDLRIGGL
jgi:hypothetical protein